MPISPATKALTAAKNKNRAESGSKLPACLSRVIHYIEPDPSANAYDMADGVRPFTHIAKQN